MLNKEENELMSISMIELEKVLLEATMRLDIEMFKEFYIYTEDYKQSKRLFLLKDMAIAFNKFIEQGDTSLKPNLGICNRCNKGCYGHILVGNNSKNYMNLLFENDVDKIIGVAECADLKTANKIEGLNKRIYLHEYNEPGSPNNVPF
ncbi:hypothetical protein WFZ85_04400 [Flavobacterium sp. j3]|uniref:Uncharacterized protein n=1 Tax=Flavobacterium aureirubrum TaxID=3133147 RepID=A0ABU9N2V0_9FLAO